MIVMESYVYNAVLWQFYKLNFICLLHIDELANSTCIFHFRQALISFLFCHNRYDLVLIAYPIVCSSACPVVDQPCRHDVPTVYIIAVSVHYQLCQEAVSSWWWPGSVRR